MAEVNEVTNEQVIVLALDGSEESEKAVRCECFSFLLSALGSSYAVFISKSLITVL